MRFVTVVLVLSLAACTPKEPVEIGASCSAGEKTEACAVGKVAHCVGGKWEESTICPQGCVRKMIGHGNSAPVCEGAVARAGAVCVSSTAPWKTRICTPDLHGQLVCEGGRWKMEKTCATTCGWNKDGIFCQ